MTKTYNFFKLYIFVEELIELCVNKHSYLMSAMYRVENYFK